MAASIPSLSKSRFTLGLQCTRLLWWTTHERDAPELVPDATLQARFDSGNEIGALARERFPGGVLIDAPYTESAQRLQQTRDALAAGATTLFEAAFTHAGVFVAVDILTRNHHGWTLTEVKSTTSVKPQHLPDAAVQTWVLRANGIAVTHIELMHLNTACTYPALEDLFTRTDITADVERLLPEIAAQAAAQLRVLEGSLPDVAIGPHCRDPYECPFMGRCWHDVPEHHVTELYQAGRKAWELVARGITLVRDVPDDFRVAAVARRQIEALRTGARVVKPGVAARLAAFQRPLAVLDFETLQLVVPRWDGCHPYEQIPAQFSVQREQGDGTWAETGWLAAGGEDPRADLITALIEALTGSGTILTWNVGFERGVIRRLAQSFHEHQEALRAIEARLDDLLPVVRDHIYDPEFHGSFSIKRVLPVLAPGEDYGGLQVAEGGSAMALLAQLVVDAAAFAGPEREALRTALLRYCARDTSAVVELLQALAPLP